MRVRSKLGGSGGIEEVVRGEGEFGGLCMRCEHEFASTYFFAGDPTFREITADNSIVIWIFFLNI